MRSEHAHVNAQCLAEQSVSSFVLGVLVLLLIVTQRDRGPEVDGRPLEEWVQDLLITAAPDRRVAAQSAVAQLGTNALPWLQLAVRHTDPIWKLPLLSILLSFRAGQNFLVYSNFYF